MKVLLNSFHIYVQTLGFYQQTQKLEPPCTEYIIQSNLKEIPQKIIFEWSHIRYREITSKTGLLNNLFCRKKKIIILFHAKSIS